MDGQKIISNYKITISSCVQELLSQVLPVHIINKINVKILMHNTGLLPQNYSMKPI